MRLKIRAKYGAAPVVVNEKDEPIEGVKAVRYSWEGGKAVAQIVIDSPAVIVEAESEERATVAITPPKASAVATPKSGVAAK